MANISVISSKPKETEFALMSDEYEDLKHDMVEIKEKLSDLITLHKVGQKDHDNYEQSIKRAFQRLEKLESRVEGIRENQLKNGWISHIFTACLTGVGTGIAILVFKFGA